MKKVFGIILLLLTALPVCSQGYWQRSDSVTICHLLDNCKSDSGPLWFARQLQGRPYVAHTLEGNDPERLVVNTRQLDCTTFVETVAALTICSRKGRRQWSDYLDVLQQLRYRGGVLNGYTSRLHYFTDWIADNVNKRLVEEIQDSLPPFSAIQTVRVSYMSQHPKAYEPLRRHPEWTEQIRQQELLLQGLQCRYIPKSLLSQNRLLRRIIRDGDILAITCNKKGLDIAHLGFAVWHKDGLHLFNASQLHKKVVEEAMTLYCYMQKHPTFTGIRIIRIK